MSVSFLSKKYKLPASVDLLSSLIVAHIFQRQPFLTDLSSVLGRPELMLESRWIHLDWQTAAFQVSVKPPLSFSLISWMGTLGFYDYVTNCQPSRWATSETTTGLLSEEGAFVISIVGSHESPSWGTVAAGWPNEATINRNSLVRRGPVPAIPLMALVGTLEELFKLEPRRGASHCSRAWKHL